MSTVTVHRLSALHGSAYLKTDLHTISYTPNTDYVGSDTITYTIMDKKGNESTSTVTVTVTDATTGTSLLKKTGQTTSYYAGDDGYYQTGVTPSYTRDNTKEIVTDNITGLMWQDNSEAKTLQLTWQEAKDYCDGSSLGGYTDWRLPSVEELESIVDYGRNNPSIDPTFKNVEYGSYRSSTFVSYMNANIDFFYGTLSFRINYNKADAYFRCVRAGQ
jgi:hypothetical protein